MSDRPDRRDQRVVRDRDNLRTTVPASGVIAKRIGRAGVSCKIFERCCDTDTACRTMHFPSSSLGHIRRRDNGYKREYLA